MIRSAIRALSPSGPAAQLSIFIFHRVLPQRDELIPSEVTVSEFEALCAWLRDWFTVLPLADAVARLRSGNLPAGAACITFDDGYADNRTLAAPILWQHGLPATFFIATGFLDGGRMWNDTVIECIRATAHDILPADVLHLTGVADLSLATTDDRRLTVGALLRALKHLPFAQRADHVERLAEWASCPLPDELMMTQQQVRELASMGLQIGAHTVHHPILKTLTDDQARQEMADSREVLEGLLGERVGLFAYPNGRPDEDYSDRDVQLVRELGFDAAVSTAWGASTRNSNPYELKRFTPWDRTRLRFGLRLVRNLAGRAIEWNRVTRTKTSH